MAKWQSRKVQQKKSSSKNQLDFCSLDTNEISFVIFHMKVNFHIMHGSTNRKGKGIQYH